MLLTKSFSAEQYRDALACWEWIGVRDKTPVLASLFGDLFLQDASGYWFLDTMEGSLTPAWASRDEVQATLDSVEGQDRYLLGGLAMAADRRGVELAPTEVYALAPPPILGGPFDPANIMVLDFAVALNLAGQLHEQVRSMPPGTPISGMTVEHDPPAAAPTRGEAPHRGRWRRRR